MGYSILCTLLCSLTFSCTMVLTISGEPFSKAEKEFAGVMKEPRTKIKTDTSERHHLNRLKSYSIMRMKKENFELDLYDFKPHIKRNRNKDIHNKPKNISGLVLPSELLVKPNLNVKDKNIITDSKERLKEEPSVRRNSKTLSRAKKTKTIKTLEGLNIQTGLTYVSFPSLNSSSFPTSSLSSLPSLDVVRTERDKMTKASNLLLRFCLTRTGSHLSLQTRLCSDFKSYITSPTPRTSVASPFSSSTSSVPSLKSTPSSLSLKTSSSFSLLLPPPPPPPPSAPLQLTSLPLFTSNSRKVSQRVYQLRDNLPVLSQPGPLKIPETQNSPKYFETNNAPHHNKSVTFDSYSELLTREEKIIAEERNIFRKKTKPIRRQEARANVNPLTTMLKHPNSEISKATLSPSFHSQFFGFSKIHRSIHSSRNRHVYVNDSHNPKRVNELTKKLVLKKRSKRNVSMAPTLQNNFSSPTTSSPDVDSNKGTLSYSPESATPDSDMARILYHNSSDLYSYLHITNNSSSNTIKSNISDSQKSIRSNKNTERIHDLNISDRVNTRLNEFGELTGYEDRLGSSNNDQPTQHTTSQDYFSNRDATTATYTSRLIAQRPGRFSSPLDTFEDILPRRTLHIGGFFELSGPYPGNGQSDLDAALLAIDHVNDQFIIPGYRLELLFNDSKVRALVDTDYIIE